MKILLKSTLLASCAISSIALMPLANHANAAAFYIQEQSVSGLGSAFAGAGALGEDASTIFYNPAGMTELDRAQVQLGTHILSPDADFVDNGSTVTTPGSGVPISTGTNTGGNPFDTEVIPNAFFAYPVAEDDSVWLGLGITAPFGLVNDYGLDWVGRYESTKSELITLDFAPSMAWEAYDWLSIGAGVNIQYADAELENAIPSPSPPGASPVTDGLSNLSGDDTTVGFNVGILLKPLAGTNIGLHYRSAVSHTLEGRLFVSQPNNAGSVKIPGEAGLDLPGVASLSLAQDIGNKWKILGSVTHIGWDEFDSIPVNLDNGDSSQRVLNYNNSWSFALGARYQMNSDWVLRAGYQFDETPTEDGFRTTSIPDGDRQWVTLGASYHVNDNWELDLGAAYIDVDKEDINLTESFSSGSSTITGTTEGNVGIISLGMSYKF